MLFLSLSVVCCLSSVVSYPLHTAETSVATVAYHREGGRVPTGPRAAAGWYRRSRVTGRGAASRARRSGQAASETSALSPRRSVRAESGGCLVPGQIAGRRPKTSDSRRQTTDRRPTTEHSQPPTVDFRLQTVDRRPQTADEC